uniref:PDZ domain-containing protein n=1 Tax=Caenorhabditis tropicalis TaxID=1561998 RepID=A0A1I7U3F8_9PELO
MIENDYAVKVAKYPPILGSDYPEEELGPGAKMLRGPGQKSSDPFQFVAVTKGGDEMAESAKNTLQMAQQQKAQREKMLQGQRQMQKFDDSEPWQANLDTWRKKRKEKFGDRAASENTVETPKKNDEYASYQPRKTKEEILHMNSASRPALPRQHSASTVSPLHSSSDELNNDSGIDNRTVGSPSTSEFSPRSTDLFVSPKSIIDEEPPHHPPPPPPVEEKLDQVLIPLKLSNSQDYAPIYRSLEKDTYYDQCPSESDKDEELNTNNTKRYIENTRLVEQNQYMPVTSARVEATFKQPPPREGVKPFVSRAAQELNKNVESKVENIDLTVELNREQKATVTATKYPRTDFIMEDYHRSPAQTQAPPPMKSSSTTRIYHAVDIPFDESPASYYPKQTNEYQRQRRYSASSITKQDGMFTLNVVMGSQPVHKGMGFSTFKRDNRVIVESVIVGSPADKAGLLVGDTILSINGEDMSDKYQSGVTRILHEAARVGEADVLILRAPAPAPLLTKQMSTSSTNSSNFDKARSVFTENKSFDSYAEFKRKHSRASRDSNSSSTTRSSRDFNSLPRGATTQSSIDRKRDTSLSSYRTAKDNFNSSSNRSSGRSEYGDYRVTSYQEKNSPGRLTDFVPEVDRRLSRREQSEEIYLKSQREEEPRTIRNYHLSNDNIARTNLNFDGRRDSEEESTTTTLKRSTLPRSNGTQWKNEYSDGEEVVEKLPVTSRESSPLRSALKKSSHNYYHQSDSESIRPPPPRRFYSTESLQIPIQKTFNQKYSEEEDEEIEESYSSMRRHRQQVPRHFDEFHTVGSYGMTPQRSRSQQPTRFPRYDDTPNDVDIDEVSGVTHRFYDRSGNHVRAPRERTYDIQIQRDYGSRSTPRDLDFVRNTYKWEEQQEDTKVTTTTKIYEKESRDWRDVINQQRQAAPGNSSDRRGIAATSASLSNLPTYINRRMEKEREREREYLRDREYSMPPVEQPVITEKYERDEYSRVEERTYPIPVARNTMRREETQTQVQNQLQREDTVVAVSGKHRCAHCNEELGRGAAMIVESLNLFYHLACFKCYVCKTSLGSGATGADVRVRDGRLHCQTCYSNDRVQLSKV